MATEDDDTVHLPPVPGSWGDFIGFKGSVEKDDNMMQQPFWFVILYMFLFILVLIFLWIMAGSCPCVVVISILISIGIFFLSGTPSVRPTYTYVSWTAWLSLVILLACLICLAWLSFRLLDDSDAHFDAKLEMILQGGELEDADQGCNILS